MRQEESAVAKHIFLVMSELVRNVATSLKKKANAFLQH